MSNLSRSVDHLCDEIIYANIVMKLAILYDNDHQVVRIQSELPDLNRPRPRYVYDAQGKTEVHMIMTAAQIVMGMKSPAYAHTSRNTLYAIPRHCLDIEDTGFLPKPGAGWRRGDIAWGIKAVQGWVVWKMLVWLVLSHVIGLVPFVVWLVLVDKKDLQNASVGYAILMGVVYAGLTVVQYHVSQ